MPTESAPSAFLTTGLQTLLIRLLLASFIALMSTSSSLAQGDLLGSNRSRSTSRERTVQPRTGRPDVAYAPDPNAELRLVRLLGEDVVYRLEEPDHSQEVYRDMAPIRVVVCDRPPCDVWLPHRVSLAVQMRGRNFAVGRLALPPQAGLLRAAIRGRSRRIAGGMVMLTAMAVGLTFIAAAAAGSNDELFSPQPFYNGAGAAILAGGVLAGGIMIALPFRGTARWQTTAAGPGSR